MKELTLATQLGGAAGKTEVALINAEKKLPHEGVILKETIHAQQELSSIKNTNALGNKSETTIPSLKSYSDPKFAVQLQKQLEKHGDKSISKTYKSIKQLLEEHRQKLPSIEYKSSVEREIKAFERQIETLERFCNENKINLN